MSQKYTNKLKFNNGVQFLGQTPGDDREVWGKVSDLFITAADPKDCGLYGKAYTGMKITVLNEDVAEANRVPSVFVLNDATPYTPGSVTLVDNGNYHTYWTEMGWSLTNYVNDVVDSRLDVIEGYIKDVNIEDVDGGAVVVTPTVQENGHVTYTVDVTVDDDSLKVVDEKLATGKYSIEKIATASDELLASYQLMYKAPGATDAVAVDGASIEIPKDYVLKTVEMVKGSYVEGEFVISSKEGESDWAGDEHDVYMHFEWNVESGTGTARNTYLKVSDVISIDIAPLEAKVTTLRGEMDAVLAGDLFYHMKDESNDRTMITSHGAVKIGTKESELTSETLSKIVGDILFERAEPIKIKDTHIECDWTEDYKNSLKFGYNYPTVDDFIVDFVPETWRWESHADKEVVGDDQIIVEEIKRELYFRDYEDRYKRKMSGDLCYEYNLSDSQGLADYEQYILGDPNHDYRVKENDPNEFFIRVTYVESVHPVDSDGLEKDAEDKYYREFTQATDSKGKPVWKKDEDGQYIYDEEGHKVPVMKEFTTDIVVNISDLCYWPVYSNASLVSSKSLYDVKNTEPQDEYKGANERVEVEVDMNEYKTLYFQWPSATKLTEPFYIYLANNYEIDTIGGANDIQCEKFNSRSSATCVDSHVMITNEYDMEKEYGKYEVKKASGITTVQLVVKKIVNNDNE